ncbi:dicarboxylate/amino acid:cation symporter, partial [Sphingomonas solaris]
MMADRGEQVSTGGRPARFGLSARILAALVIGLALGATLGGWQVAGLDRMLAVAQPIGRLWLDALTMTVVPLVFGLLVTGIASAADGAATGGVARRALLWFAALLVAACAVSAVVVLGLLSVWPAPAQSGLLGATGGVVPPVAPAADWLTGLIPTNPIKAAADTAMVPLVVFALLFGFAITRIAPALRDSLVTFFRAIVAAMLVIVDWVLWLAPAGGLGLFLAVGGRAVSYKPLELPEAPYGESCLGPGLLSMKRVAAVRLVARQYCE